MYFLGISSTMIDLQWIMSPLSVDKFCYLWPIRLTGENWIYTNWILPNVRMSRSGDWQVTADHDEDAWPMLFITCIVGDSLYQISSSNNPTYTTLPLTFGVNAFKFFVRRNSPRPNVPCLMMKYSSDFKHHSQHLRVMKMNLSCAGFDSLKLFGQNLPGLSNLLFHLAGLSEFEIGLIAMSNMKQYHACNGPDNVECSASVVRLDCVVCFFYLRYSRDVRTMMMEQSPSTRARFTCASRDRLWDGWRERNVTVMIEL